MGQILIREMNARDTDEVRRMVGELHDVIRPMDGDLAPTGEILDAYFDELCAERARTNGEVFVAELDGALVGYAWIFGRVPPDKDEWPEAYTVVSDLYVRESARKLGVGAMLMERAEAYARSLGTKKIELKVLSANTAARKFYGAIGYKERVLILAKRL